MTNRVVSRLTSGLRAMAGRFSSRPIERALDTRRRHLPLTPQQVQQLKQSLTGSRQRSSEQFLLALSETTTEDRYPEAQEPGGQSKTPAMPEGEKGFES